MNSRLVNGVPLSETTTSGNPRVENDLQSSSIVDIIAGESLSIWNGHPRTFFLPLAPHSLCRHDSMVSLARCTDGVELIEDLLVGLAVRAFFYIILVHSGPPHEAPGKCFHPSNSLMTLVQHLQHLFPSFHPPIKP